MSLSVNIPLQTECYVKLHIPKDFDYNFQVLDSSGIFVPADLDSNLAASDYNLSPATSTDKTSLLFHGCNSLQELGSTPSGRLYISSLKTQDAIKDSGTFGISIYKDLAMTKLIAKLVDGVRITASQLKPGLLSAISIEPDDFRV